MGQCWPGLKRKRRPYPLAPAYRSYLQFQQTAPTAPVSASSYNNYAPPSQYPWPWASKAPQTPAPWATTPWASAPVNLPPYSPYPQVQINPRLSHQRDEFNFLEWNISDSPFFAVLRSGQHGFPVDPARHLNQWACLPHVTTMSIVVSFDAIPNAAVLHWPWTTIHVERNDGGWLRIGDVLQAIHAHVTKPLSRNELNTMTHDRWLRLDFAFRGRVAVARAEGRPDELRMERRDFLEGRVYFNGIKYEDGEFLLSLSDS